MQKYHGTKCCQTLAKIYAYPKSCPAHKKISGMNSCLPALKNIDLHRSLLTIGTVTY